MKFHNQIHVVDSDAKRRADIAFTLNRFGFHTHVYEDVCELERFTPSGGLVLLSGEDDPSGLSHLQARLLDRGQYLPIAMFSTSPSAKKVVSAMQCGAVDYLEWPTPEDPATALAELGRRAEASLRRERRRAAAKGVIATLTTREREVLTLVAAGHSNKEIASSMGISPRTVEIHRANMMEKLGAESTASAVRTAIYAELCED